MQQVIEAPGTMELAFMGPAERVLQLLETRPLIDVDTGEPFATRRIASDGVMAVDGEGIVTYASPNAVNIMGLAGFDGALVLVEAVERVSLMAVVHEMLASATEESVDFAEVARTVVDMVRRGMSGGAGSVVVSMRRLSDALHLSVRDDGAGLPVDFDASASAHLGLAIVKTVVEDDLRGALDFSSTRTRGTTVTIRVPLPATPTEAS